MEDVHDITAAAVISNNASAGVTITPAPRKQFPQQQQQQQLDYSSYSRPLLPAAATLTMCPSCERVATVADNRAAHTIFQRTCSGCHAGGGNILQPGATLFAKDLERNDTASVNDIFKITYSGKGRMPGYGENCTPRGQCTFGPRISDSDIHTLAEFVRLQADQGWSKTIDP
ncbi:unnamed protein product [Sphagnum jensenii]|uniref:Cytochrome c-553 n=1 Tax=Sphagnum jensenii TaxID=128206 RepID=A0ABP0WDS1_9BRYO